MFAVRGTRPIARLQKRYFWKNRAVPKHVQPIVDQVKPVVNDALLEVYKPLLEKLTSIDNRLEHIEEYMTMVTPRIVKINDDKLAVMIDPKDFGEK